MKMRIVEIKHTDCF